MTPEEFRAAGHLLVDWLADYRASVAERPVRAQVNPGDISARLPKTPPGPASIEQLLEQLARDLAPGITQVQHPMYYHWFPANASPASVLGDFASGGLGALGISWESCPALAELEIRACDWLRQLAGLSAAWQGNIQDTASTACLTALIAARERASGQSHRRGGLQACEKPLSVYTTAEAHSSVAKAVALAGLGRDNLREVATDRDFRMRPDALAKMIEADKRAGLRPAAIVAAAGSTEVTAFDPLDALAELAKQHDLWLHVDAAMAGTALLLPECRQLMSGIDAADSLSWNLHKWLGTNLDCSLFYVREPAHLVQVMHNHPSYLHGDAPDGYELRDWSIPLGRRFRALKIWFHLQLDGVDAWQARLRRDLTHAQWLKARLIEAPDWHLLAPVTLQTLCLRHQPENLAGEALDQHTRNWVDRINRSGDALLGTVQREAGLAARISIGSEATEAGHVEKLWGLMQKAVSPPDGEW